jgi:SH3-like domain-containing protein
MRPVRCRYGRTMPHRLKLVLLILLAMLAAPATAQDREVPYWASLRSDKVNMRVGPGEEYPILWVFKRKGLPLKVVRLKEGWRLVEDPDGARGWMLARFLTLDRGGYVRGPEPAEMRDKPASGRVLWRVKPGVSGMLGDCEAGWCRFDISGQVGFVAQDRLWGAGKP